MYLQYLKFLPVKGRFVWTVVEDLQELRSSHVEHELRVQGEVVRKPEAVRIVFVVLAKLLTQPDQHPVHPAKHVRSVTLLKETIFSIQCNILGFNPGF